MVLFIQACTSSDNGEQPVAEVGGKRLYHSDISEMLPDNISNEDSILMAGEYINKWIKQELLIQKADENLSTEQKNVDKQLEEYRKSLIIYKYKNELIKQRMDTVVTFEQVEHYYNTNQSNFNLRQDIIKAIFIKVPTELADQNLLNELIKDTSEDGLNELRDYCVQYAKAFDIFTENWVNFRILNNNLPQPVNNPEQFLNRNDLVEMNDSNYYYLVSILDFKLVNDLAPIEFVENNIKNLILNQRKIEFLKGIEENVYEEGIRQNRFRIYN